MLTCEKFIRGKRSTFHFQMYLLIINVHWKSFFVHIHKNFHKKEDFHVKNIA